MALFVGDRLGPYEIPAPIGAGGMGEVYKARDTRLDRTVAVKVRASGLFDGNLGSSCDEKMLHTPDIADSWQHPYTDRQPAIWFHEVFRTDGTPYKPEEVAFIRKMTGKGQ